MFSMYIVWYLFLAGTGSGAYAVAALFSIIGRSSSHSGVREYRIISRGGFWLGPLLVALGIVFLVLDLGSPEKAFTIFLTAKLTILNFGAWSIVLFCLLSCALIFFHHAKQVDIPRPLLRILDVLALLAALAVMAYTGVLVSSMPSVPFLSTPLIVVLFIMSSFSSGTALITLYGFLNQHKKSMRYGLRIMPRIDLILIALEVVVLAALLLLKYFEGGTAQESVLILLVGDASIAFWFGVVALGVFVPVVFAAFAAKAHEEVSPSTWALSAVAVLASALALRYCLLVCGLHLPVALLV